MLSLTSIFFSVAGILVFALGLFMIYMGAKDTGAKKDDGSIIVIGLVISVVAVAFPTISIDNHIEEVITMRMSAEKLAIFESREKAMDAYLATLHVDSTSLMNTDNPIASVVQAKLDINKQTIAVKLQAFNAKKSIEERKFSGFWWVPLAYAGM